MAKSNQDIWARWLLQRRSGGDPQQMQFTLENLLYPIRDKILNDAQLKDDDILLDVGCGDGLIAFGALDKLKTGKVIFSDISQDLLDYVQLVAADMQAVERCAFLRASADDLSALDDASVDVVTTRSVLIYVAAKQKAFHEFYRVLKPGGRLSIFEPINRYFWPEPPGTFWGYDATPVKDLAEKVEAIFLRLQPPDTDPMLDFGERDLLDFAQNAGFAEIHLELRAEIRPAARPVSWETWIHMSGNPKIPTFEEAIHEALTPVEADRFVRHLRPLVETNQGTERMAVAFLSAVKR
jgi:arsenite methyltransferase